MPHVPGRGGGPARRHAAAGLLHRGGRGHGRRHDVGEGQEGPGRRARVPAGQPPARLPGLRQGRRVPAAGPDAGLRPGRDALHRGEAALREAHRHFGPGPARPRALHSVRPLHPFRLRRGGRGADRLRRTGRPRRGLDLPHRALLLVLQRQHGADLPRGCAHRDALPLHRPPLGPRSGRVHLHRLLRRLPGRRAVVAEPPDPAARHRLGAGQPRMALRQGPLLLRVGQRRRGRQRPGAADRGGRRGRRRRAGHRIAGRQPRSEPGPVPRRGTRDGPLRARPPGRAAYPQGRRAGGRQLGRGPGRRRGRSRRGQERRWRRRGGADRRRPADQRSRLRLGQAGQGRHRHRLGRRPGGRRPPRRARARPAPRHHRRGLRRAGAGDPGRRPARGAPGPLPAPARGRGRRRDATDRGRLDADRADRAGHHVVAPPPGRCAAARPRADRRQRGDDHLGDAPRGGGGDDGPARDRTRPAGRAPRR